MWMDIHFELRHMYNDRLKSLIKDDMIIVNRSFLLLIDLDSFTCVCF